MSSGLWKGWGRWQACLMSYIKAPEPERVSIGDSVTSGCNSNRSIKSQEPGRSMDDSIAPRPRYRCRTAPLPSPWDLPTSLQVGTAP